MYLLKNRHRLFSDPRLDFDVADLWWSNFLPYHNDFIAMRYLYALWVRLFLFFSDHLFVFGFPRSDDVFVFLVGWCLRLLLRTGRNLTFRWCHQLLARISGAWWSWCHRGVRWEEKQPGKEIWRLETDKEALDNKQFLGNVQHNMAGLSVDHRVGLWRNCPMYMHVQSTLAPCIVARAARRRPRFAMFAPRRRSIAKDDPSFSASGRTWGI